MPNLRKPLVSWALALPVALTAIGCSGSSSTATTAATTQTTETFSGSVPVKGSDSHNFSVSASGTVLVTLTVANPADAVMGVGIGTPSGASCALLVGASVKTAAGTTAQLSGLVSPGALCVQVYDVGQASTVSYTVTVTHP